jgi:H+/Cl- antiporter ClcA
MKGEGGKTPFEPRRFRLFLEKVTMPTWKRYLDSLFYVTSYFAAGWAVYILLVTFAASDKVAHLSPADSQLWFDDVLISVVLGLFGVAYIRSRSKEN